MLMEAGYAVLNPGLSMMHPNAKNIAWESWIASDLAWVEVSDMVIRLPGESKGAEVETSYALSRRIPVLYLPIAGPLVHLGRWIVRNMRPTGAA